MVYPKIKNQLEEIGFRQIEESDFLFIKVIPSKTAPGIVNEIKVYERAGYIYADFASFLEEDYQPINNMLMFQVVNSIFYTFFDDFKKMFE